MEERPHWGASAWVTFLKNSEASTQPSANSSSFSDILRGGFLALVLGTSTLMSGRALVEGAGGGLDAEMLELEPMDPRLESLVDTSAGMLCLVSYLLVLGGRHYNY